MIKMMRGGMEMNGGGGDEDMMMYHQKMGGPSCCPGGKEPCCGKDCDMGGDLEKKVIVIDTVIKK